MNIHSLVRAIGMGLPMAIGTAIANPQRKVVGLVGDGGLSLNLGELATLAQEKANVTLLIMNDGGYGVMRGIQDKYFGGKVSTITSCIRRTLPCWHRRLACSHGALSGQRILMR